MNLNHLLFEYLYFFHTLPDKSVLMAYLAYLEWCDGVERASATFVPPPGFRHLSSCFSHQELCS